MLQQLLYSHLVVILASLGKLVLPAQCAFPQIGDSLEQCSLPEVHTSFFDNDNVGSKQPPELHIINSTENLNVDLEFPFQYILMSCSASYPVEWVGNVPQHYYYSYILDDEIRSIVKNDASSPPIIDETSPYNSNFSEKFTVRLHIGNETFTKPGFTNVSVSCQSVNYYKNGCGKILANVTRYKEEGHLRNRTMLRVRFSDLALNTVTEDQGSVSPLIESGNNNCAQTPIKMESKPLQCSSSSGVKVWSSSDLQQQKLHDGTNCSGEVDQTDLFSQLPINTTNLAPSSGVLTCKSESDHGDIIYNVPYFLSLPKLCPNEDITLPHIYYKIGSSIRTTAASTSLRESEFLSICVQNASTNEFYVGETVSVTCISSIYYFAQGIRVQLFTSINGQNYNASSTIENDIGSGANEQAFGPVGYRNLSTNFIVGNETTQEVHCSAPVRKSRRWVIKKILLKTKQPVRLSFQKTHDTALNDTSSGQAYIICNVSGDPLPDLSWSRLNDEKLPSNQTVREKGKLLNSSIYWVSSKLYFPTLPASVISEYYGRYICIARNKFNVLEKTFLFDERSRQDDLGDGIISSGFFGRAVWFWITITFSILLFLGIVFGLGWRLRKQALTLRLFTKAEIDEFVFGRPELLLDDSDSYEEMNTYAAYLPYDRHQFEIEQEHLEFNPKDILGTGAYGTVYKGIFKDACGRVKPVAIKTVSPSSDKTYFAALLSEIKIMCYIGQHGNVVRLIGACTKYLDQRKIFVATEFCPNGDLLSYILNHRNVFMNNTGMESKRDPKDWVKTPGIGINGYCRLAYGRHILSPHLLLVWALQIAQGMTFLSSKKVVHGDLAARNILLADDLKPKIADFGLSNKLQKYANYVRKEDDLVPWRWLAVECIQFMKFSTKSDVWAFGVILYELFSLGQVPYGSHCYSELFVVSLCQGERLPRPEFAKEKLYGLMLDCWKHYPEDRPSFEDLQNELKIMCADSEQEILRSLNPGVPHAQEETEPNKTELLYVNSMVPQKPDENFLAQRNGNINQNTRNGYVMEVEPSCHQIPTNKPYVNADSIPPPTFASFAGAAAPSSSSYIDWNIAR